MSSDWGTQFIGMCSKKCKVAWDKYANKHATVAQVPFLNADCRFDLIYF